MCPAISDAGYRAPDGTILSFEQAQTLASRPAIVPGRNQPGSRVGQSRDRRAGRRLLGPVAGSKRLCGVTRVAPIESYPTFENAEILATSTIGIFLHPAYVPDRLAAPPA